MSDLSDHVIIPRADFADLQFEAYSSTPLTQSERNAGLVRGTIFMVAAAACVTAGSWGWAKAVDWREERALQRRMNAKLTPSDILDNKK